MLRAIVVPEVGAQAPRVSAWYAHPGEQVYAGDRVVELLLGAATFDVTAPCSGRLAERTAWVPDLVAVGQVLGYIEEDAEP